MTFILPYLIAKAKADMGNSPSKGLISTILGIDSVVEIENMMGSTNYAEVFTKYRPSQNIIEFEGGLRKQHAERLLTFRKNASPKVRDILDSLIMLEEAENLKLIFRAFLSDDRDVELLNYIVPVNKYGLAHYKRMLQVASAELATDLITYRELKKAAKDALSFGGTEEEQLFYITSNLEHAAYSYLFKQSKSLKVYIDMQNLMTVCRASALDIDPTKWIIPNKGVIANNIDVLKRFTTPREIITWALHRVPFSSYLQKALEVQDEDGIIGALEKQIEIAFISTHRLNFSVYTTDPISIFSYFELKKAELKDIGRIVLGKVGGLDYDTIREALTYYI